MLELEKRTGFA